MTFGDSGSPRYLLPDRRHKPASFRSAFVSSIAAVNENLQFTAAQADPAAHQQLNMQREAVYAAYQAVSSKIDPNDASEAQPSIDRVLANVNALQSKAAALKKDTEAGVIGWQAREADFDRASDQVHEMGNGGYEKAKAFQAVHDAILAKVKQRNYSQALSGLDPFLQKLAPAYAEFRKPKESPAAPPGEAAVAAKPPAVKPAAVATGSVPTGPSAPAAGGGGVWDFVKSGAASAWENVGWAGNEIYSGMKFNADLVQQGAEGLSGKFDALQATTAAKVQGWADMANGIPVLEQVADSAAWVSDQSTQIIGQGAIGVGAGVLSLVANPVDAPGQIYAGMKSNAELVEQGEHALSGMVDSAQDTAAAKVQGWADMADGIPVLEQAADTTAWGFDQNTQFVAGVYEGAIGMGAGLLTMVANPVDTAKGLAAMAEHTPIVPFAPNPFKMAKGAYDVVFGDAKLGETADRVFNPVTAQKEDTEFWTNAAKGFLEPYGRTIGEDGDYMKAVGRAGFDIASFFIGAGEVKAASVAGGLADDAARLGTLADDAVRAGAVADDAAKAGTLADDAARAGNLADDAAGGGKGGSGTGDGGGGSTPSSGSSKRPSRPEVGPGESHPTKSGKRGPRAAAIASKEGIRARIKMARERLTRGLDDPLRDLLTPDELEHFIDTGELPKDVDWHHTVQTSSDYSMADEVETIQPTRHREHIYDEHQGDTGSTPTAGIRGDVTTPEKPIYDPNAPDVQTRKYDPNAPGEDDFPMGDQGREVTTGEQPIPDVDSQLRRDYPELFDSGRGGGSGGGGTGGTPSRDSGPSLPPKPIGSGKPFAPISDKPQKLKGGATPINPNADAATQRSLRRENETAEVAAQHGYDVEQNPPPKPNGKKPDYKIQNEYFDCYAPDKGTKPRNIWTEVKNKVGTNQVDRVIINIDDWGGDLGALRKQFSDWDIPGLQEVKILQGGRIFQL